MEIFTAMESRSNRNDPVTHFPFGKDFYRLNAVWLP
jgi:hypothetical protein